VEWNLAHSALLSAAIMARPLYRNGRSVQDRLLDYIRAGWKAPRPRHRQHHARASRSFGWLPSKQHGAKYPTGNNRDDSARKKQVGPTEFRAAEFTGMPEIVGLCVHFGIHPTWRERNKPDYVSIVN
jgi:hypothetical protein